MGKTSGLSSQNKGTTSRIPVIHVKDVMKYFRVGGRKVTVLRDVSLSVKRGALVVIFGPSGCGKSTLLNTIIGLEQPSRGNVYFHGRDLSRLSDGERARIRNARFGMLYQQSHWVRSVDVIENVAFPMMIRGRSLKDGFKRAEQMLQLVGLTRFRHYHPSELSGGQQQKVGLARSLIMDPEVLVADEPTGNLDTKSGWEVIHLLRSYIKQHEQSDRPRTVIMVTHNVNYIGVATDRYGMEDGLIVARGYDVIKTAQKSLEMDRQELISIPELH